MKKKQLLFFAIFVVFQFSCVAQFSKTYYPLGENLEFRVKFVYKSKSSTTGSGNNQVVYLAKKGKHFKAVVFKIRNNSDEDKTIDFEKFKLIDAAGDEYTPKQAMQAMKLTFNTEKLQFKLKAGKSKAYIVEFWPPYPKYEKIKKLMIGNRVYELL